nr:putative 3,4-dihydroxy-2-butanone kinase isoform X1 [Tanacetum cinerariifolium]
GENVMVLYVFEPEVSKPLVGLSSSSPFEAHCRLGHTSLQNLKKLCPEYSHLSSLSCDSYEFAKRQRVHLIPRANKRLYDDLFTYEVEINGLANLPCDLNKEDDSEQQMTHGSSDDMDYDLSNARGDDEVELTHKESSDSDDEDEVAEIFRIETNMYELNKDVPWVHERPWTNNGAWEEPTHVKHYYEPFSFIIGHKEWPTCSWKDNEYFNEGNLPKAYIVGNTLCYQDLEWYAALEDSKLIDKGLKNKAIMEGIIDEDNESHHDGWRRWDGYENAIPDHKERMNEEEHGNNEICELFDQERPVCNIRRFEMIKYSFGDDKEYVAVKEDEYCNTPILTNIAAAANLGYYFIVQQS